MKILSNPKCIYSSKDHTWLLRLKKQLTSADNFIHYFISSILWIKYISIAFAVKFCTYFCLFITKGKHLSCQTYKRCVEEVKVVIKADLCLSSSKLVIILIYKCGHHSFRWHLEIYIQRDNLLHHKKFQLAYWRKLSKKIGVHNVLVYAY